jgi:hypothetical protein
MVYHGMVTYSLQEPLALYLESTSHHTKLLRSLEYGALPAQEWREQVMTFSKSSIKTMIHGDKEHYDILCEKLGHLQYEFIENHREIIPQVFETTYSNGQKIIVNYSDNDFNVNKEIVKADSFLVI